MPNPLSPNPITQYIADINLTFRTGAATEHSYRPALQRFIENIAPSLRATNEPRRQECGAPDYIVTRNQIPVGYIEAKDIGSDLNSSLHREQFDRYKKSLNNLIITDYLTFQLFADGALVSSATIARNRNNQIEPVPEQYDAFNALIDSFAGYEGLWIQTSMDLSNRMAAKAKLMAAVIEKALNNVYPGNAADNSLEGQFNGFKEVLISTMKENEFADIYAQTIAYGMFAAKLNDNDNEPFTRMKAAELIPRSNPFLRRLFQYIAGYDLDQRIQWIVDDLADLFNNVDINEIYKEFDRRDHDPVIHFYETFLSHYDPALRRSRGVWYTPKPVVQFIVQAVDCILKTDFSLTEGLTDSSIIQRPTVPNVPAVPQTTNNTTQHHRVQILDPATGTGTFLAEIIRNIYNNFADQQGMWQNYVREHLIPRLNGFEILMASYAMAHLNVDMLFKETGYNHTGAERLRIFLTNSLDEPRENPNIQFAQWLSEEANQANLIKTKVPVMVILGNPPYSVSSQNNHPWINSLLSVYKEDLNERNIQPLSDDYIKFIRLGQFYIGKNGEGILAYISNNSFLDGLIHRQMRKSLLESFDTIYILDLHGNTKKKETAPDGGRDENVFDIQQGVSINIFIKTRPAAPDNEIYPLATVFHADLYGQRTEKYSFLANNTLQTVPWRRVDLTEPMYFFVPKNFSLKEEYDKGFSINEVFVKKSSGIVTHDDANLVSFAPFNNPNNQQYAYRPFDNRFINYDLTKVQRHRNEFMQHFIKGENIGLITCRQQSSFDFQHVFVSSLLMDKCTVSSQTKETGYVFPLFSYRKGEVGPDGYPVLIKIPNLNSTIITQISQRLQLPYTAEENSPSMEGAGGGFFTPIDIFDYIYAILHSPTYRERYKELLKIDFPRIPYPDNQEKFWQLIHLGGQLRRLHLLEGVEPQNNLAAFPIDGDNLITNLEYLPKFPSPEEAGVEFPSSGGAGVVQETPTFARVFINNTQYFDRIPTEAWNFYIGGYQPAQKWLKDRKGRKLGYDDIEHYQKIIRALKETEEIMKIIE